MAADLGLCIYCNKTPLTGSERPEHAIPNSLGSSLETGAVCDECNTWAGRALDQPFLADDLLRSVRSQAGQLDPRRGNKARRPPNRLLYGVTADGDRVGVDPDTGMPRFIGGQVIPLEDGRYTIRAGTEEEAKRLLDKMKAKMAAEGKDVIIGEKEVRQSRPQIKVSVKLDASLWRRQASKIGLAVGSLAYPLDWRSSHDAHRLREWMNNRDPQNPGGSAPMLVPTSEVGGIAPLLRADEHLVFFQRMLDGLTYVVVVLFGALAFAVPVDSSGGTVPHVAWRLDWRRPKQDGTTTFDELVVDYVKRANADAPDVEDLADVDAPSDDSAPPPPAGE